MTHMYFSQRTEGRISYGHLGRTSLLAYLILQLRHLHGAKPIFVHTFEFVKVICRSPSRQDMV